MSVILSVLAAFACFTRIPMPRLAWDERTTRYLLAAMPVVGVAIGAIVWLAAGALAWLGAGPLLKGVVLALVGVAAGGSIHLDGFADVCDALASHADPARRRDILKDPHVGAFAVLGIASWLALTVALASELDAAHLLAWCATYVVSRALCAHATLTWRARPESGMLSSLRSGAAIGKSRNAVLVVLAGVLAGLAVLDASWAVAVAIALAGALCYGWVWRISERAFDGMSGDIAGFLIVVSELCMQAAVIIAGRVW